MTVTGGDYSILAWSPTTGGEMAEVDMVTGTMDNPQIHSLAITNHSLFSVTGGFFLQVFQTSLNINNT